MQMKLDEIINILENAKTLISNINSLNEFENFRVKYLSRNGLINNFLNNIKFLPLNDRKSFGKILNDFKSSFTHLLDEKKKEFVFDKKKKNV